MEEDWERLGLTLLASDEDKTLILFASNHDLQSFRDRLQAYAQGTPPGQAAPSYNGFITRIEEIGAVEPRDRIGLRLREEGLTVPEDFHADRNSSSILSYGILAGVNSVPESLSKSPNTSTRGEAKCLTAMLAHRLRCCARACRAA